MKICFYVFDDFQLLDLSGPVAAFQAAERSGHPVPYPLRVCSLNGGMIRCSAGFHIETRPLQPEEYNDLFLIVGGKGVRHIKGKSDEAEAIRRACLRSRCFGSLCTGAFALAELGLLDGKKATTHWKHKLNFEQLYPGVNLSPDALFIRDGNVWTSAGITSGIDLALAIIEEDAGASVSMNAAQELVVAQRRHGGQSQYSPLLLPEPESDRIRSTLDFIRLNPEKELSISSLADRVFLSTRQFCRQFRKETGETVAKVVERIRADTARGMLESGHGNVDKVAKQCGFGSTGRMRRTFIRLYNKPPQSFRQRCHH